MSSPKLVQTQAVLRKRPDGEIVVILPCWSGDPTGAMAVGFQITGYEFPCNPDLIIENTTPATEEEAARVLRVLRGDLYELSLEIVPDLPDGSKDMREAYPLRYREFARLSRLY